MQQRKQKIGLIADSTCDLPESIISENSIGIIPVSIYFENEVRTQYVDISTSEFFSKLATEKQNPTTGVPAPKRFLDVITEALEKHEEVIILTLSSKLSGVYSRAILMAKQIAEERITVLDSRTVTLPFGLIVLKTARMIREGLKKDQILEVLQEKLIPNSQLQAFVGSLKYLKRSGRIDTLQHLFGELLNYKPLITIENGKINSKKKVRGEKASWDYLKKLGEKLVRELPKNETLIVAHSQLPEKVQQLANYLKEIAGNKLEILTWEIGPAIGVHVGPGAIGLIWIGNSL